MQIIIFGAVVFGVIIGAVLCGFLFEIIKDIWF